MKHAKPEQLNYIAVEICSQVRLFPHIFERIPCHFYYRGKNILHFHEDKGNIYADIGDKRLKCDDVNAIISEINLIIYNINKGSKN